MPPKSRKRVKKAESNSNSNSDGTAEPNPVRKPAPLPRRGHITHSNHKGFLTFPPELFLKIAKHFPEIHVNEILSNPTCVAGYYGAANYKLRFQALRALSQTCHHLREFYLPLLWERFEACMVPDPNAAQWFRHLGEAMERKSMGMLKSKHLWPYVRIVTVSFTRYKTDIVLPPFAKLLGLLPNVHTLQIPHTHSAMTSALKEAFEGSSFLTIRTVIMPNCAHEILRCCPQVESVTCNEDDGGKLVSALAAVGCGKLQVARGFSPGPTHLKRFIKASPPLRLIRVQGDEATIRDFAAFPSLRIIEIECSEYGQPKEKVTELIQIAKDILQACASYVPPSKPRKGKNSQGTQESLADLYADPRAVKVRYYSSARFQRYASRRSAMDFVPTRIETFLV